MKYFPLRIYLIFTIFSVLALYITPLTYKDLREDLLFLFLSFYIIFFVLGFWLGMDGVGKKLYLIPAGLKYDSNELLNKQHDNYHYLESFFKFCLTVSSVYWILEWIFLGASGKLMLTSNIGAAYVDAYSNYERGNSSGGAKFFYDVVFLTFTTLTGLIGFYYLKVLNKNVKKKFYFVMASYVIVSLLSYGKQKYLGDVVIFGVTAFGMNSAIYRKRFNYKIIFALCIFLTAIIFLFGWIINQRYTVAGIGAENISNLLHPLSYWNEDHFIFYLFPDWFVFPLSMFLNYFSNGLYGLSLCLQLPFEWTYMVGNSYSLTRIVEIFMLSPDEIFNKSYPIRVDTNFGWDFSKWVTVFPWLAGDITFVGVIPASFLFAFSYGRLWKKSIKMTNPYAAPLFIYLSLGLAFSYANNQLFHSLQGIMVFIILVVQYLKNSKRKVVIY